LARARRLPVVWLSFQECTGCTESLTRSSAPGIERLLFDIISIDYHHTLQAAAGEAAEAARERTLKEAGGGLLLVVDGSVPTALDGACATIAGEDNLSLLTRCLAAAEAVVAVGTCASFSGLPAAAPNPTGAMAVVELMHRQRLPRRPLVNLPGCSPYPRGDQCRAGASRRIRHLSSAGRPRSSSGLLWRNRARALLPARSLRGRAQCPGLRRRGCPRQLVAA